MVGIRDTGGTQISMIKNTNNEMECQVSFLNSQKNI